MKIGIVTPYALPEKGASSMRVDSFRKYMVKENEVTIITRHDNTKETKEKLINMDHVVLTCPSFYKAFKLIPFLKGNKIKFTLDIIDLAENTTRKINILFKLALLITSNNITVVTKYMKSYLSRRYFINKSKIDIVPNGVDTDIFYPSRNKVKIRKNLDISKDSTVLIYEGIIGDHNLLDFINLLTPNIMRKNKLTFLMVVIVGETEDESTKKLKQLKNNLKSKGLLQYFRFVENAQPEKLRDYISCSDFGLAPIPVNNNNLYRIPIKAYDYVSCGTPVIGICPKGGELTRFIMGNDLGYSFNNWKSLLDYIPKLKKKRLNITQKELGFDRNDSAEKLMINIGMQHLGTMTCYTRGKQ